MGKFFDAMQRASAPEAEAERQPAKRSSLPELDQSLLEPEGAEADGYASATPPEQPRPVSFETQVISVHSDVFSAAGAAPTPNGRPASMAPSLKAVKASPKPEPSPSTSPRRVSVSKPKVARKDSPLHLAYERIIQRLFAYRRTPRESVILVTSAVPEEGASTVARNIALALRNHRTERVLLIDANLRNPSQHEAFKIEQKEGLGDVLLGPTPLTSAVHEDVVKGLSLLTSGQSSESPAQILTVAGLHGVIMAMLSLYDWVIIDGPPATKYPDVSSIAAACGGAILVVRAEDTRLEVVEEAKKILETSGVDLLGAVLNRRRYHIPNFIYKRL